MQQAWIGSALMHRHPHHAAAALRQISRAVTSSAEIAAVSKIAITRTRSQERRSGNPYAAFMVVIICATPPDPGISVSKNPSVSFPPPAL